MGFIISSAQVVSSGTHLNWCNILACVLTKFYPHVTGDPYVKVSDSLFLLSFLKIKFYNFMTDSVDILTVISSFHVPMNYYNRTTQQGKLSNIMIKIMSKYICLKEKNVY